MIASFFAAAGIEKLDGWLQTGALATLLFFLLRWTLGRVDRRDKESAAERVVLIKGLTEANRALTRSVELQERDSIREDAVHLELTRTQREIFRILGELQSDRQKSTEIQRGILEQIKELRRDVKDLRGELSG